MSQQHNRNWHVITEECRIAAYDWQLQAHPKFCYIINYTRFGKHFAKTLKSNDAVDCHANLYSIYYLRNLIPILPYSSNIKTM